MFMQQTAAFIAIANKSAPITSPTISSENGEIAAVRRGITFFSVRYFSEKCAWARISRTLERARQPPRNLRPPRQQLVLQLKERRLRRLRHQHHLRPAVLRQQQPQRRLPLR